MTSLPLRITVRCSSMCRWNGCTQPPPPLRISQRLKLPFFCWASGVLPAGFFRLRAPWLGSNALAVDQPLDLAAALPRWTSKISRLSIRLCQLLGSGGRSRSLVVGSA